MRIAQPFLGALLLLAACDAPSFVPTWNADVFFPVRFPDIGLRDYASAGVIPPTDVNFTTPLDSQVVESSTQEILSDNLNALRADVILSTGTDVAGYLLMSVSPNQGNLFSRNPALALTDSVPIRKTAADTSSVEANVALFQNVPVLYLRARGVIRSATGGFITVSDSDKIAIGLELTANVTVVK